MADANTAMTAAAAAIAHGVDDLIDAWVRDAITRILDAWARLSEAERAAADAEIAATAARTRSRIAAALRDLFAQDIAEQRSTPLAIVRTAGAEATDLLRSLGIPDVDRDAFDARTMPEDHYDLAPRALADLGDADLGAQLVVWGVAKSRLLRNPADSGLRAPE